MQVEVVIPSHKRAGRILTLGLLPSAIVCVPESQAAEYRAAHPGTQLVLHPDSVVGLAAKRNWMYQHFGDLLMLDDDITDFRRMYLPAGEPVGIREARALAIIQETAYCARAAGAYLWGFNSNPNPTMYKTLNPISLTGYVTGCATGLLRGSKLWYNSAIVCNEDYWISCLNAYHHRLIYKDTRFNKRAGFGPARLFYSFLLWQIFIRATKLAFNSGSLALTFEAADILSLVSLLMMRPLEEELILDLCS